MFRNWRKIPGRSLPGAGSCRHSGSISQEWYRSYPKTKKKPKRTWKLFQKRLKEAAHQGGVHFSLVWGWNVWMTASGTYIPGDHPWHRMEKYGFWVAFVITPVLAQCSSSEQVISKMEILAFVLKRGRELTETGDIFYSELLLLSCAKLWKHHTFTVLLGSRGGIQRWLYCLTRVCWHECLVTWMQRACF